MTDDRESLSPDAGVGRVALRVGDLDRLVAFYEGVVGLSVRDRDASRAVLGTGDEPLFVLSERADRPPRAGDETGLFHAAVRLPTREALGDALARVEDRWQLTGASDHLVSEALYLDDPEGNGIELYHDRARDDWPTADDGRVAMETLPLELPELRELSRGHSQVPDGTDVGHVHLEVSNLDATRRFYTEGLGMRVRQTYGTDAVFLAAGDYHHHVGANVWNRRTVPGDGLGLDWFEIRVPDEAALESARKRFQAIGRSVTERDAEFSVEDPDRIELRVRERGVHGR